MRLNTIKPAKGSKPVAKRLGRGHSAGQGKTAGRGVKGQRARAGGYHKVGFEGGQTPIQRRLPKFGFISRRAAGTAEVRLHAVANCQATVVRLGDVAEILSDDPAIAGDLAAVALFPAPGSGKTKQLDRHQVRQLLAISGVDLSAVFLTGSEFVVVQAGGVRPFARPVRRTSWHTSPIRLASYETSESPATRPSKPIAEPDDLPPLVKRGESVTIHSRAAMWPDFRPCSAISRMRSCRWISGPRPRCCRRAASTRW